MDLSTSDRKRDKFLQSVLSGAFFVIFCLVGMAMIGSGSGSGAWGVGLAAAAGCASVAYIAKLVISVHTKGRD